MVWNARRRRCHVLQAKRPAEVTAAAVLTAWSTKGEDNYRANYNLK
jgi:hypothetical protein